MRRILRHIIPLLLLFPAAACDREQNVQTLDTIEFSNVPIGVCPSVASATRGSDPISLVEIQNFGMSAIYNLDTTAVNRWLFNDQMVLKETVDADAQIYNWIIQPQAFWPLGGKVSFFFYTPFNDPQHPEIQFVPSTIGMPGIIFTPGQDVTNHYDFCVAPPLYDRTSDQGSLSVTFDHVLSRIHIHANYDGILPPGQYVMIDSLRLENIYGTKVISFKRDGAGYQWQDESGLTADASYIVSRSAAQLKRDSLVRKNASNDNHKAIYESAGRLYLIPQHLGSEATLKVNYGFYIGDISNPTLTGCFEKRVKFPSGTVWPMGKAIRLNLTLGVGESSGSVMNVTISDWTDSNNRANGGNPKEYE